MIPSTPIQPTAPKRGRGRGRAGGDPSGPLRRGKETLKQGSTRGKIVGSVPKNRRLRGWEKGALAPEPKKEVVKERVNLTDGTLITNHWRIRTNESWHQHVIDFGRPVSSSILSIRLVDLFLKSLLGTKFKTLQNYCIVCRDSIVAVKLLPELEDGKAETIVFNSLSYPMRITYTKLIRIDHVENHSLVTKVLNIIISKVLSEKFLRVRNRYFNRDEVHLPSFFEGAIIYSGNRAEIGWRKFGDQVHLTFNVDPVSQIFGIDSVQSALSSIMGKEKTWTKTLMKKAREELIGVRVWTSYNRLTYIIRDLDFETNLDSTFSVDGNPNPVSYRQYYLDRWGLNLSDPHQPMIKTTNGSGQTLYLVPEASFISHIPESARKFLPRICSVDPGQRLSKCNALASLLRDSKHQLIKNFNVKMEINPYSVPAKKLPLPHIIAPGLTPFEPNENWSHMDKKLNFSKTLPEIQKQGIHMYLTYPGHDKASAVVPNFVKEIAKALQKSQAPIYFRKTFKLPLKKNQTHVDVLSLIDLKEPLVLICCLEDDKTARSYYSQIKKFCSMRGYISQCILYSEKDWAQKEKNRDSIVANIKKQLINKFGFLCWWIDLSVSAPSLKDTKYLIIGIDIYRSKITRKHQLLQKKPLTVCAFVALLISDSGVWDTCSGIAYENFDPENSFSRSRQSLEQKETLVSRDRALEKFMNRIKSEKNFVPDYVLVYRTGYGTSVLDNAKNFEAPQIRYSIPNVKLTYIVVQKQIYTKFILKGPERAFNPPVGTLVDGWVGCTQCHSFYLVPASNNYSTVSPVHYVLAEDDRFVPLEQLQRLSYDLCFAYPNWTDSINLPSPSQCAFKLGRLIGETHETDPQVHPNLFGSYWYL